MKHKSLNKRLILKRETIVNLNERAMDGMLGGYNDTVRSCISCPICHPSDFPTECDCPSTNPGC